MFRGVVFRREVIAMKAVNLAYLLEVQAVVPHTVREPRLINWNPLSCDYIFLHTDGSRLGNSGIAGFGFFIRNSTANWTMGGAGFLGNSSILR